MASNPTNRFRADVQLLAPNTTANMRNVSVVIQWDHNGQALPHITIDTLDTGAE